MHAVPQAVHVVQMLLPQPVNRRQHHITLQLFDPLLVLRRNLHPVHFLHLRRQPLRIPLRITRL